MYYCKKCNIDDCFCECDIDEAMRLIKRYAYPKEIEKIEEILDCFKCEDYEEHI